MHGHLVTVEVSVEGCTDEWVQLDRFAFDQLQARTPGYRDGEASARGSACTGMFTDHLIEDIPDLGPLLLHELLRLFHRGAERPIASRRE